MKMHPLKLVGLAGCLALLSPLPQALASQQTPEFVALSQRWLNERDQTVSTLAQAWLNNQQDPRLKQMLLRLIALEVRLSTRENTYLYTAQLGKTPDADEAVRKVSLDYLRTTGWEPDSAGFINGKSFDVQIQNPQPPASHAADRHVPASQRTVVRGTVVRGTLHE